jgi:hypothetical protein
MSFCAAIVVLKYLLKEGGGILAFAFPVDIGGFVILKRGILGVLVRGLGFLELWLSMDIVPWL